MAETNLARRFDGSSDTLAFGVGNAVATGAITIALVVKLNASNSSRWQTLLGALDSAGNHRVFVSVRNGTDDFAFGWNGTQYSSGGSTFSPSDGWTVLVFTKGAG